MIQISSPVDANMSNDPKINSLKSSPGSVPDHSDKYRREKLEKNSSKSLFGFQNYNENKGKIFSETSYKEEKNREPGSDDAKPRENINLHVEIYKQIDVNNSNLETETNKKISSGVAWDNPFEINFAVFDDADEVRMPLEARDVMPMEASDMTPNKEILGNISLRVFDSSDTTTAGDKEFT